jgi:hypothetical protein
MKVWMVVFSAVLFTLLFLALLIPACGEGGGSGACTVDCSNMFTGKIDVRNYTFISREDCIKKGKAADCPTEYCIDGTCETVY